MQIVMSDPFAVLWQGDALEVLAQMEAESVDLVVTSPPYYGLRRYPDTERAWGGREDCEHNWQEAQTGLLHENRNFQRGSQEEVVAEGRSLTHIHKYSTMLQGTCALCGAWRGSYGNEPLADCGAWMRSVLTGEPMELCKTCYLCHSVLVLRAIRRVMKPWATCWWVVDDSMMGDKGQSAQGWTSQHLDRQTLQRAHHHDLGGPGVTRPTDLPQPGIKAQDRMGIPERLSLALQADGWHWRSTIIWSKAREIEQDGKWTGKGSTMPESVGAWRWVQHQVKVREATVKTGGGVDSALFREDVLSNGDRVTTNYPGGRPDYADCPGCPKCSPNGGLLLRKGNWRPTDSYERIIMLAKSLPYFGNAEAAAMEPRPESLSRYRYGFWGEGSKEASGGDRPDNTSNTGDVKELHGRNPRSVWEINPEPFAGGHFATFPSAIPRKIILATTSAKGNCPKCKMPWVPVVERPVAPDTVYANRHAPLDGFVRHGSSVDGEMRQTGQKMQAWRDEHLSQVVGWLPSCRCAELGPVSAVVLDPFAGTGTTLAVAKSLGRRSIGIELSARYCALAARRLAKVTLPMEGLT